MIEKIKQVYSSLSDKDKRIADFMLSNYEEMLSMNINELAERTGVSASTISRFSTYVFSLSFPQLKVAMAKSLAKNPERNTDYSMSMDDSLYKLSSKLLLNIGKLFEETFSMNSSSSIETAAKMIMDASNIYIFGIGASGFAVQDLAQKLIKLQKRAIFNLDANLAIMNSSLCTKDDLVIAISYSGLTKEVLLPARKAKELGCQVISISGGNKNKLTAVSDLNLAIPLTESKIIRTTAIYSRYGQFLIIDMIYLALLKLLGEESVDTIMEGYSDLLLELKN